MRIYKLYSIIIWSPDAVNPATPDLADWAAPQHNNPFTPRKRPFPASLAHRPTSKILINYAIFPPLSRNQVFNAFACSKRVIEQFWFRGELLAFSKISEISSRNNDLWNILLKSLISLVPKIQVFIFWVSKTSRSMRSDSDIVYIIGMAYGDLRKSL